MKERNSFWLLLIIFNSLFLPFQCHQKTLRKIVRAQSKMMQRPFSDGSSIDSVQWKNSSTQIIGEEAISVPGFTKGKTLLHKSQRPKIQTILSTADIARIMTPYSRNKSARSENNDPFEFRLPKNLFNNLTKLLQTKNEESLLFNIQSPLNNSVAITTDINIANYYEVPKLPANNSLFYPLRENKIYNSESKLNDNIRVILASKETRNSPLLQGVYRANVEERVRPKIETDVSIVDKASTGQDSDEKVDFLIEEITVNENTKYNVSVTERPHSCASINEIHSDIDAQAKYSDLDIQPTWMTKKQYWNNIFDSRYESLMRNPKWPSLNVILIPCSHVDSIWKKSFEIYHNNSVSKILSNIVKKLQFYKNFTFTWNEVSHLSHWWQRASQKSRAALRKLLKSGRIEITTGGWVESDEATSHLYGLVHQLIEGHQWLKQNLNYTPKVGWLTNSVTHSPTLAYLLSAGGITQFVMTNIHFSWEKFFAEFQYIDFMWLQSWDDVRDSEMELNQILNKSGYDRYPKNSVLAHYLQFNSDNFKACGPDTHICLTDLKFYNNNKYIEINTFNVKQKAELLLEQYSKTGTLSSHNVVLAPIGGRYRYENQTEFDYQYNNYQKLADFININSEIYKATVQFGTPKDYFNTITNKVKSYPTIKGDFVNFADIKSGVPAYWTGFFTTRPLLKILLRRLLTTLRSTEILLSFAVELNVLSRINSTELLELLIKTRETVARLQDRHVVGGTLSVTALHYVYKSILGAAKDCWRIQEVVASLLTIKPKKFVPYLQKFIYRQGEFISTINNVGPGDQFYVFNSLSHERTEIVELPTNQPNVRILDYNKKEITVQINPVWSYTSHNWIKISDTNYKIVFAVVVPAMTFELFKIKETFDATYNGATIYCQRCFINKGNKKPALIFNLQPLNVGDIQLENYKHRIIVDEMTGFLKTITEKERNLEHTVVIDYGAFKSANVNAGMFLFNTDKAQPLHDILLHYRSGLKKKASIIISGQVTTEMTSIFGRLLQHTIKLFNLLNGPLSNAIYIESKVDYEVSPKNRDTELFLSIKTNINNGNHPVIYTDNNGFQYTGRLINISRPIESNVYPITTMAFLQDSKSRLTVITDHTQGVTALQEGQLALIIDRRILFDDGRGTEEGLADSVVTSHRHFILIENLMDSNNKYHKYQSKSELILPSYSAIYLSKTLMNDLDIFIVDDKYLDVSYYKFMPLIKKAFPCDVAVITSRIIVNKLSKVNAPNVGLLVLHRQSFSCNVKIEAVMRCEDERSFLLEKIYRTMKGAYQTNLGGTFNGVPTTTLNLINFPPMELIVLKIFY